MLYFIEGIPFLGKRIFFARSQTANFCYVQKVAGMLKDLLGIRET
jgi:hypothetical protein